MKRRLVMPRMAHHQRKTTRRRARWITIFGLLFSLLAIPPAEAAISGGGTCSSETVNTGVDGNVRTWAVVPSDTSSTVNVANGCANNEWGPAITLRDVNAGASITLKCLEGTAGAVPPSESEAVVIKGFPDNDNFGNTAATPIWTWTIAAGNCNAAPTNTVFCTVDGATGTAARYGIVRVQVHASRTTVVAYDSNSEAANPTPTGNNDVGVYRCDPKPTAMQPTNTPAGANVWVAGNTYDARVTLDSAAYGAAPGNTGDLRMNCANKETAPTSSTFGTSASIQNTLLAGTPDALKTGCTLKHNATLTKTSSISLYSGTLFAIWNTASPITGVTFPSSTIATFTSKTLNRILTPTGTCTASPNPVNRGATETVSACNPWQDANGVNVVNNKPGQGWYQRAGQYESWDDFPSANGTFGAQGQLTTAMAAKSAGCTVGAGAPAVPGGCAAVTTSSGYHKMVQTCTAACTAGDANLEGWGNTSNIFDVSATWTFDNIIIAKSSGGANTSSFTIGNDVEFFHSVGLRDANSVILVGQAVTCTRLKPDNTVANTVAMGNTVAVTGNSPEQSLNTDPPQGNWHMTCTANANGNFATFTITFTHTTAFTADKFITIHVNFTSTPSCSIFVNVTTAAEQAVNGDTNYVFPDQAPIVEAHQWRPSPSMAQFDLGHFTTTLIGDASNPIYGATFCLSDLAASDWRTNPVEVHVIENITTQPFLRTYELPDYYVGNFTGNFSGNAVGSFSGSNVNVTFENVTYLNATHIIATSVDTTYLNASIDGFEGAAHANATWCPKVGATCSGNFTGNFTGNGQQVDNVTAIDIAAINGPGWTLVPYVFVLAIAFLLILAGTRIGPGFSLIGAIVAIIVALASLGDASASALLKSFLMVAALASILATIAIKRSSRSF